MNFFQKLRMRVANNKGEPLKNNTKVLENESVNLIKVDSFLDVKNSKIISKNLDNDEDCVIVEFCELKKIKDKKKSEEDLKKNKANSIPDILA